MFRKLLRWFCINLLDLSSTRVPGTSESITNVRESFEVEMTTETATRKKIIGEDSKRDETCPAGIRPSQPALAAQRECEDDWFEWFDAIREKPVAVPPGTFDVCMIYKTPIQQMLS